ncbi:hypothetical protein [Kordia zhangzhouensis]|nr:hypothetical protein [Kordia zhangzhouensis]
MKKRSIASLHLNKKSISNLNVEKIKGGETSSPVFSNCCVFKKG